MTDLKTKLAELSEKAGPTHMIGAHIGYADMPEATKEYLAALVDWSRTGDLIALPAEPDGAMVERVARAVKSAECNGREGPFGGYDYGHNEAFYGPAPEDGRYVIRDFRDPSSSEWGKWVHQTHDRAVHEAMFEKMTSDHIATAACRAVLEQLRETGRG